MTLMKERLHRTHQVLSITYVSIYNRNLCFLILDSVFLSSGAHVVIDGDTDLGYVEDGTACGTDHICFNHKCLPIQQFNFSTCPGTTDKTICSGHGVHTHTHTTDAVKPFQIFFFPSWNIASQEFFKCCHISQKMYVFRLNNLKNIFPVYVVL